MLLPHVIFVTHRIHKTRTTYTYMRSRNKKGSVEGNVKGYSNNIKL